MSWAFTKSAQTCATFSCLLLPRRRTTGSGSCFGMGSKVWSTTHSSTPGIETDQLLNRKKVYAQSGGGTSLYFSHLSRWVAGKMD